MGCLMVDQPDGRNLLEEAERVLREQLLPALPPDLKLDALMVAAAIATAQREISGAGAPRDDEAAATAADLRAGRLGGDPAVYSRLLEDAERRVAIAAPKLLEKR